MVAVTRDTRVRTGYQHTDMGVIPEDWEVKEFGELGECIIGLTYHPENVKSHGLLVLRSSNIADNRLVFTDNVYVDLAVPERLIVRKNDILICVRNGSRNLIGKCALIDDRAVGMTFGAFMSIFRTRHAGFVFYAFQSDLIKRQINENIGATINQITNRDLRSFRIPLPTKKHEQLLIVDALQDVDRLLDSLDRLIAKKRSVKQATMQQLLTGEIRLSGFSGEWRMQTFGDVITGFVSGATPSRSRPDYFRGDIRWITSGELNYNVIMDTNEKITSEAVSKTNLRLLPAGTFLMAITGLEAEGTRGSCGIVGADATTNQSCMALFPGRELSTNYLFHYYVYKGKSLALQYCQGTKQQSYTANIVKLLPILLPPLDEQEAIATVLSDMDAEIAALEQRRDKTQAVKQGMMQELLTGRRRLV